MLSGMGPVPDSFMLPSPWGERENRNPSPEGEGGNGKTLKREGGEVELIR